MPKRKCCKWTYALEGGAVQSIDLWTVRFCATVKPDAEVAGFKLGIMDWTGGAEGE